MATEVDKILVRIEADLADFKRDMAGLKKTTEQTTSVFKKLGPILAAAFSGVALRSITNTVREFEDLQATLKAVTGSAEMAQNSFDLITKFTATTTFQLEEVTGAFITLQNAGIAPTSDVLKDVGNLAAAYGKDIRDVAQAIMNATTGEMEMLKQLGVIARVEGENLAVTYKGVTQTIDRSADSIVGYLRELSQANFGTAIEERSNTLSGAISNLQDNFSLFIMQIGDAGFRQSMTDLVKNLIGVVNSAKPLAIIIGRTLAAGFRGLGIAIDFVMENLRPLILATGTYFAIVSGYTIVQATRGYYNLAKSIVQTTIATEALGKANLKNILKSKGGLVGMVAGGAVLLADQMGAFESFNKQIDDFLDKMMGSGETAKSLAELDAEMKKLGVDAPKAGQGVDDIKKSMDKLSDGLIVAKLQMEGYSEAVAKALLARGAFLNAAGSVVHPQGILAFSEQMADIDAKTRELAEANEILAREQDAVDFAKQITPVEQLKQRLDALWSAQMKGAIGWDEYSRAARNTETEIKMLDPAFSGLVSAAQSAAGSVADAITDMVMSSKINLDSFKDIARQFIAQLVKMQIMGSIMNPIMNRAFGLTGTDAAMPEFSLFSGNGLFAPPKAGGGAMSPNIPTLVGERGPELFIPSSAGTLMNNMNTKNALGGGSPVIVNQSLNFAVGVTDTVRAEVINMLPAINESAVSAVQEAKLRGGSFASSFGS